MIDKHVKYVLATLIILMLGFGVLVFVGCSEPTVAPVASPQAKNVDSSGDTDALFGKTNNEVTDNSLNFNMGGGAVEEELQRFPSGACSILPDGTTECVGELPTSRPLQAGDGGTSAVIVLDKYAQIQSDRLDAENQWKTIAVYGGIIVLILALFVTSPLDIFGRKKKKK